jgi:N6-L-threonylcarbamoyladenine synthase
LAYVWQKPLLGIHHIEGHIYANFIGKTSNVQFPILCLVVSGGHTQLVLMKDHLQYQIVGQTLDDAAGEAFDKVARILGIGYPGGPKVSEYAAKHDIQNSKYQIQFPRPMLNKNNFNFSFSGLKTAVLYETKKNPGLLKDENYIATVCHEFQQAAIDVLIAKTLKAAEKFEPQTILLAGGVSANSKLRKQLGLAIKKSIPYAKYQIPDINLTGDNAAMIAAATFYRFQKMPETRKKSVQKNWKKITADANLKM